jgi:hypothetical protein
MKHYFIELTASYIPKNKAHKAIQEFVRSYNHVLTDEEGKGNIKLQIGTKLAEINKRFGRCNDIKLSGFFYDSETMAVDGNFILAFKDVKIYELSEPIAGSHFKKV